MKAVSEHMKELEKSANKNEQTSKDSKMSKKLQSESGKSISHISKGQLISKGLFGVIVSTKKPTKLF